jgi:hypothetical protein
VVTGVSDDDLLPLRQRLRDWEDFDVASFYLGKALGVIAPEDSFSEAKGLFYARGTGPKLVNILQALVDQGFVEQRDPLGEYGEYRWRIE